MGTNTSSLRFSSPGAATRIVRLHRKQAEEQGGVMQADSGPQVCYWLAKVRCRDAGINAECLKFTTSDELVWNMLECLAYTAK